jgi:cell division protease FtsH
MSSQFYKNMALWVVIVLMLLVLVTMLQQNQPPSSEISYSEFLSRLDSGELESVVIEENHLAVRMKRAGEFATYAPGITDGLLSELKEKKVEMVARPPLDSPFWKTLLIYSLPFLLFTGLWIFFVRDMRRPR